MPTQQKKRSELFFLSFFRNLLDQWTNEHERLCNRPDLLFLVKYYSVLCTDSTRKPVKLWSKSKKNQGKNRKLFYFFQTRFSRNDEKGVIHGLFPIHLHVLCCEFDFNLLIKIDKGVKH